MKYKIYISLLMLYPPPAPPKRGALKKPTPGPSQEGSFEETHPRPLPGGEPAGIA